VKPDPLMSQVPSRVDLSVAAPSDTERTNNTLRAYQDIKQRILDGAMPAGSQFLEQELAEMLGMSRTPVREALIRLADERLVEVRPRHGARVLGVSADELNDIYEICSDLEALAARRLAQRGLSDNALKSLEAACVQMEQATTAGDFGAWVVGDKVFHDTLVTAAGNTRLAEIYNGLMAQVHRARRVTMQGRQVPTQSNREHREIVQALKAHDAERAHKLMFTHRDRSRGILVDLLRRSARSV
jgi:DNA-binding GntR family transcriptional regulator